MTYPEIFTVLLASLPLLVGCPMDDDDDTGDEGSTSETYSILGTVARAASAPVAPTGDGIGTLYIVALTECAPTAPAGGAVAIPGADVTEEGLGVAYEIGELPPGDYFLALFLDDDLDADLMAPQPGPGDLVFADVTGDGVLSCVAVTIDNEDAEDVDLMLTATVPPE